MFFNVIRVNKSIYRGFKVIRVHLVHQKVDIVTIVSTIANPVKPIIKKPLINRVCWPEYRKMYKVMRDNIWATPEVFNNVHSRLGGVHTIISFTYQWQC